MKSKDCHLENATTPRVVWASKTRNHSANVTTLVVWVAEIMNTQDPMRKKNSLRNLSFNQTRMLTLPQQQHHQRRKNSLRNLSSNQTRMLTLPLQQHHHQRHHQVHHHREQTGREDRHSQRNPGINWTEELSQSSCSCTQLISQPLINLCLTFRLESRVSLHTPYPAWRVTLWPGLSMQVGSMSHERSPENKKRRRCVHEIKTTNQQAKGSGVFQLLLSRRKEKSAGWLAVRTSETLKGVTVTRLPETPAWISIRQSIFKTDLFQAETNGYNQAMHEHILMTITSTSSALRSHALDSSEARSSMYPLCHRESSSTWTTSGPARGWRSASRASAAAISSSPGSSLPTTWGPATSSSPRSSTSRSNSSGLCSAQPAISVKTAIWNMMAASMTSSPESPAASAPRTGGRTTLCLLEDSAALSSSTNHSSIHALSDTPGEEADGSTEEPELPSARGSPAADSPLPGPPSEKLGLLPNRGAVSTISSPSSGLPEADGEGDGVQVPDRSRRGGQVAAVPEQRSRSTRWHLPHLSHPRNPKPLSWSLKSWSLKSPSVPAERHDPKLKLHSSVPSLLLSAGMQHDDSVEMVFPILRAQLLRCLRENVPPAGVEELKYLHASFIKPKHTKGAASKPPRAQAHIPRRVLVICCKESFDQLERKDATVKTSTKWYSSKTGPAKAHANTSLPSKVNHGIMSPIKRAKPGARTRARARKLRARGEAPVKKHTRVCMEITRRSSGTTFQRYLMRLFGIISNEDGCGLPSSGKRRDPRLMAQHGQSPAGAAGSFLAVAAGGTPSTHGKSRSWRGGHPRDGYRNRDTNPPPRGIYSE